MELREYDLTWIPYPIDECLTGAGPLEVVETEVSVHLSAEPAPIDALFPLGHCEASGLWYGLLSDLDERLQEAGHSMGDVEFFSMHGSPVDTGVTVRLSTVMPWSVFVSHLTVSTVEEERPTPSDDTIRSLPQLPTTWEVGQRPVGWVGPSDDEVELTYVAIIHDPSFLRATRLTAAHPLDAAGWTELFRRAAGVPAAPARPARPRTLRSADPDLADRLREALSAFGVRVETADTPLARAALDDVARYFQGETPPPYFTRFDPDTVRRFHEDAARFLAAAPWTVVDGDRYVGVQINDRPWLYVTVMGHVGDTPGLCVFDDWLQICRFFHNDAGETPASEEGLWDSDDSAAMDDELDDLFPFLLDSLLGDPDVPDSLSPLEAAGAFEAASPDPRAMLHPEDAVFLDAIGATPDTDGHYVVPRRFDATLGVVDPRHDASTYALLFAALTTALGAQSAGPLDALDATPTVRGHRVRLRYPADGTERAYDGPAGVRLTVSGADAPNPQADAPVLDRDTTLVVDSAATHPLSTIADALSDVLAPPSFPALTRLRFLDAPVALWDSLTPSPAPSPRIADLFPIPSPTLELNGVSYLLDATPLDTAPRVLKIRVEDA